MSAFIDAHRERFGVELICATIGCSASAYYERARGERSAREVEDERLLSRIRELHRANYEAGRVKVAGVEGTGSYGAGLARFLALEGVEVIEITRPARRGRRHLGKSDARDAEGAARAVSPRYPASAASANRLTARTSASAQRRLDSSPRLTGSLAP